jgi:hypothetical protein
MSTYTPNNVCVYIYAQAGCMGALIAARNQPTDPNEADYADAAERADYFAQEIDTIWGVGSYTNADLQQIQSAAASLWAGGRSPVPGAAGLTAAGYTGIAQALIAGVKAGTAQIVLEGINPNGCSGGSSSSGTGNWVCITDNNLGYNFSSQTAGAGNVCIGAVAVPVKGSGVFKVSWNLPWVPATAGQNITLAAAAIPFASGGAGFGAGHTTGSAGVVAGNNLVPAASQSTAAMAAYGRYLSQDAGGATAAAGITFNGIPVNGSAPGAIGLNGATTPTLAGLLTASGVGSNTGVYLTAGEQIVVASTNPKVPFTSGEILVVGIVLDGTGGLITFGSLEIFVEELSTSAA